MTIPNEEIMRVMQGVVDLFLIPTFNTVGYKGGSMNATGKWLRTLEVDARGSNEGVIRGQYYSEWLAKGRGPNKDQSHEGKAKWAYGMSNYNPEFMAWLSSRGLTEYGMQIAYKLADSGSQSHPQGTTLLEVLQSVECIDYVTRELVSLGRAQVKLEFNRMAQRVSV